MVNRQIVYRKNLPDTVGRIGLSRELGLLVYTDSGSDVVRLIDPAALSPVLTLATAGPANDAIFLDMSTTLAAVSPTGDGGGELRLWNLKAKKGELDVKKEQSVVFDSVPLRIAHSPAEDFVAVTFDGGRIDVLSLDKPRGGSAPSNSPALPAMWCGATRRGPDPWPPNGRRTHRRNSGWIHSHRPDTRSKMQIPRPPRTRTGSDPRPSRF